MPDFIIIIYIFFLFLLIAMLQVTTNLYMFFILFYFFLTAVSLTILVCFWAVKVKFLRKWEGGKNFISKLWSKILGGVVVFAWNLFHMTFHLNWTFNSSEPINGEVKRLTSDDCMPFNGPAFSIVGAHLSLLSGPTSRWSTIIHLLGPAIDGRWVENFLIRWFLSSNL